MSFIQKTGSISIVFSIINQARYFQEQDIDEFRDCFYLNTHSSGQITEVKDLKTIMRSLGMSPTVPELNKYLKEKGWLPFKLDVYSTSLSPVLFLFMLK